MKRFLGILFALALVFSLVAIGLASPVLAAAFTVNSTGDGTDWNPGDGVAETAPGNGVCTLRAAIQETNALAGPDTINLPAGTYTLTIAGANEDAAATGDLDITDNVTIIGTDQVTTVIDGGGLYRVLHIHPGYTVEISSVTIQNGDVPSEDPSDAGGGVYNDDGTITLTDSTITGNLAAWGGGIFNNQGTANLTNCSVNDNTAQRGGGIYNTNYSTITSATLTLTNCSVNDNTAWNGDGGGIINKGVEFSQVTLLNSIVSGNEATAYFGDGGGIANYHGLTIIGSIIAGNTSNQRAGGIASGGTLTITNSSISNNTAESDGGGISMTGTAQISNSVINGNNAGDNGAGIFNWGTATLTNVTISGNSANSNGGGLGNWLATITLTNVTINANSADGTGGGIYVASGTVNLKNTIVANSVSGGDFGGAGVTSLGYNLDSDGTGALGATGDLSNTDPLLGPLQDNGGPTFTHALLAGSPAIDAGDNTDCPAKDQRGVARPLDGDGDGNAICDIGSYEYSPPSPPLAADFSAEPTAGVVPLTVNFTDESIGDITEWSWDFGDSGTSDEQSPSHTYTSVGIYTVSLTVSRLGETDVETKVDYITVYEYVPPQKVPSMTTWGIIASVVAVAGLMLVVTRRRGRDI